MRFTVPTRARAVPTLVVLAVLLLAGLLLAPACLAQEPTPTETPLEYAYIPPGDPDVVPIIYRFTDFGGDWQSLAPELGPIGSIHFYRWEAFHTGPGQFTWNAIDVQLAKEANLKVTLLNGQIIPKPVVLQVIPFLSSNPDRPTWTAVFYDSTPEWVYREIEAATGVTRPVVGGRKVGYVMYDEGYTSVMPMYDNAIWQRYHREMIAALGARYNSHPQVTAVSVSTGLDGETQATKDYMGGWNAIVDTQYPGVRGCFTNFVLSCMDYYRAAFPNKPLFVNNAPGASGMRWQSSLYASQIEPAVGLRHCGMWEDLQGHQGGGTFIGLWDHIRQYSMTLPIWLESPYGWGAKDTKYWSWLAGLHYHPEAIDVHREWLTDTSPEMLRWVSAHLGVTIEDTPSVWTALRDTMYPILDWGSGQSSGHLGDWTFWLTRQEIAGGGTVRVWREQLPQACRGQLYSTQARRTDQANGQTYMYFDIDDGYPYVGQVPLSEPNGTVSYSVKVIFLNQGTDTLSLEYRNYAGQIVSRTLTKGPSLGPVGTFIEHTFTLEDAYLNNGLGSGTSDFRLACNGDGDEVVHFIEVTGLQGHFPTPTPSRTPTRTPTRTATPTATRTPTHTPTHTPTATPVAANATSVVDASILQSAPSTNTGNAQTLTVSATGDQRSLLYFNVSQVPAGAGIVEARLRLRSTSATGEPLPILVYGLRRDWQESEVTWERATTISPWALAGADSPPDDRDRAASASTVVSGGQIWYEWDVTELVNAWVKGEQSNHGLLLLASESAGGTYTFASSESANAPQLAFHYALATLTPTYTPTATATRTPTPGPTNTPSPTMAPTPTLVPGAVIFSATSDTYMSEWYPTENYCRDPKLTVRKGDIVSSLIYFDLSSIPLGTTINGAWLNLYCTNRTNTGEMNALAYKVRRPWVDCEVNWTMASSTLAWTVAGCNGEGTDRDQSAVAGIYLNSANSWWTLNLTQVVRDWVANPSANRGLVFKGYGNVSVEYSFASADFGRPEFRPQLVISAGPLPPTYTPTATATPGPTATRTATLTPSITPTPTHSSTPTASPTASASPTATASPTASPTATATATAGPSPTPSNTPLASPTPTATATPLPTATHTPEPTATPTATEYVAPTPTPLDGGTRFDPVADTTLNAWGPTENLGDESELLLRQPDVRSALLAFD
ncbi:MAG: DNRLRE domain-containing protein, partial [Chloroflexi bacterium]|nr:DNRLRE domain-containing protein [Chloroflexota bacterium]